MFNLVTNLLRKNLMALQGFCAFGTLKIWLMTIKTAHEIKQEASGVLNNSFSEIETTARLLLPLNSSAFNLARSLSSYLNGTELSFDTIQTKVYELINCSCNNY